MAREAFRRMGYEPVFRHVAWEDKDEALADGTVDCLWSGFMMNNCEDKYTWARLNLFSRLVAVVLGCKGNGATVESFSESAKLYNWAAARRFRRRAGRNIC